MNEKQQSAKRVISLIDLTTLSNTETRSDIVDLCSHSHTPFGHTAAICIYSNYINVAKDFYAEHPPQVKIATVANFPDGGTNLRMVEDQVKTAINLGADEVDVVMPYHSLMQGDEQICEQMVSACKAICGDKVKLKVIIESGVLANADYIRKASEISINAGADFIKTSTGKVEVNATLAAAEVMLTAIKASGKTCGFKAAGGVKNLEQAMAYIDLAESIMGQEWVCAENFRFGASGLLEGLVKILSGDKPVDTEVGSY